MIRYAISDPSILRFDRLEEDLRRMMERGATMILYRDKQNPHYSQNAVRFIEAGRRLGGAKLFLHNDPLLARELGADGVHIGASFFDRIGEAKELGLEAGASTHSLEEARETARRGADWVTLSPLFASPGKGEPLGTVRFAEVVGKLEIPVIALGGIVDEESVAAALKAGAAGFASIRYFGAEG
ncbi:thiamine phosphate synthase [Nitratifractor sp.]